TFMWAPASGQTPEAYWLMIGDDKGPGVSPTPPPGPCGNDPSKAGSANVFSSGQTAGTSWVVGQLPTDGRTLYARLWAKIGGNWYNPPFDTTYKAAGSNPYPPTISPNGGTFHT